MDLPYILKVAHAAKTFDNLKYRSKRDGLPIPSFSRKAFIEWWLLNIKSFKGRKPSCGRIDHSKGYSFDNILIQDHTENSMEALDRSGARQRAREKCQKLYGHKVYVKCPKTRETIAIIPSKKAAAELFGVAVSHICDRVYNYTKYTVKSKVPFVLEGEVANG